MALIGCTKQNRAAFETIIGRTVDLVQIYAGTDTPSTGEWATVSSLCASGYKVAVTYNSSFSLANIISGSEDSRTIAIAQFLEARPTVGYVGFMHETEDSGLDPATFRAAASRIYGLLATHAPSWQTNYTYTGGFRDFGTTNNQFTNGPPSDWWPTPNQPDLMGVDYYNWRGASNTAGDRYADPTVADRNVLDLFQLTTGGVNRGIDSYGEFAQSLTPVPKLCIPEFGCSVEDNAGGPALRAAWIQEFADTYHHDTRLEFVNYFDLDELSVPARVNWRISGGKEPAEAASGAAFAEIGSSMAVNTITGTANTDATLISSGYVDTDMDPRALCVCEGNVLRFNPNATTTLTIDNKSLMFMDTARLEMRPANAGITHTLRFTNVDESLFTGSEPYQVIAVTGSGTTRTFTLQLRVAQPNCNLTALDNVTLSHFYGTPSTYPTTKPSYTGTFPINSVGTPTGPGGTQTIVVQFPSDPGSAGALSFNVPASNFVLTAGVAAESPATNDKGLFYMGAAVPDLIGTAKTGWARATNSLVAGSTSTVTLDVTPTGWAVGDEIVISPTDLSFNHDEVRKIKAITTNTITLGSVADQTVTQAVTFDHPVVTVKAGTTFGAEVANLTRNVRIEGTPPVAGVEHRTHMMFHNDTPVAKTVKYVQLRYMGPREVAQVGQGGSRKIVGRWPFHFHKEGNNSLGSLLEGCVVRDSGSHAYVQHASHGVSIVDCVSYDNKEISFWWDQDANSDKSSAVLWDHNMVGKQDATTPSKGWMNRGAGFLMAQTVLDEGDATMRNCCAWGVRGGTESGGAGWNTEGSTSPTATQWITEGVSVFHNNHQNGFGSWINAPTFRSDHFDFVLYRNAEGGLAPDGAYSTNLSYQRMILFENAWSAGDPNQIRADANGRVDADGKWSIRQYFYLDGGGFTSAWTLDHTLSPGIQPTQFLDWSIRNCIAPALRLDNSRSSGGLGSTSNPQYRDFVRCAIRDIGASTDRDIVLADFAQLRAKGPVQKGATIYPGTTIRVQTRDDASAWQIYVPVDCATEAEMAANVVVSTIQPFALSIATQSLPIASQGVLYGTGGAGVQLTANLGEAGEVPLTWAMKYDSAPLPTGLTLDTSGLIHGTTNVAPGAYPVTVEVTDDRGVTAPKTYSLQVATSGVLQVTTSSLPNGQQNQPYPQQQITASGGVPPYTFSISGGALPTGLSMSTGGLVTGTPTVVGTFQPRFRVTDSLASTAQRVVTMTVISPNPVFTNTPPVGEIAVAYAFQLQATGGTPPYAYSVAIGPLPPGLSLSSAGAFSGTPTVSGDYPVRLQVTDSAAHSGVIDTGISVFDALTFPDQELIEGFVGSPYSYSVLTTGGAATLNFELAPGSGPLPAGLSLALSGNVAGIPEEDGSFLFVVKVTDALLVEIDANVSLNISSVIPTLEADRFVPRSFGLRRPVGGSRMRDKV